MVEARVGQLEPEEVLPVDARSYGFSGLTIAQTLAELHQRNERKPPGRIGWLAALGIEIREVGIGEDRAEPIAQTEIRAAFGEGDARDAGGVFRHGRDGMLGMERHGRASSGISCRSNSALAYPSQPIRQQITRAHTRTIMGRKRGV